MSSKVQRAVAAESDLKLLTESDQADDLDALVAWTSANPVDLE